MSVTVADVRAIYFTSKTDSEVQNFLDMATLVTTEELSSSGLSAARIDLITAYLAAHFVSLSDDPLNNDTLSRMKMGEAEEWYAVPMDQFGWLTTRFGQQALALDSSGILAASQANKGIKATFEVVGNVPSLRYGIPGYYGPGT